MASNLGSRGSAKRVVAIALSFLALSAVAASSIFPAVRHWFIETAAPSAGEALVWAWALLTKQQGPILLLLATVITCFARIFVSIIHARDVEVRRIRIRPFVSLAFSVYVVLCLPLAFISSASLQLEGLPKAIVASLVGVFGTVDFGGLKIQSLGQAIHRLADSIAAGIASEINSEMAAEPSKVVAAIAVRFDESRLRRELAQLGLSENQMDQVAEGNDPHIRTGLLAREIYRQSKDYAKVLAKGK